MMLEELASLCHQQWAGWMLYLFRFGKFNQDGSFTINSDKAKRWYRQAYTAYENLSEQEKESDRIEAAKFLERLNRD